MPLKKGKKNVGANIKAEMKAHPEMSQKQAVAIGLHAAGAQKKKTKAKKKGK